MRTIVHLSDLHFGTEDPRIVEGIIDDVRSLDPTLVAISGDLTQRARDSQFAAARSFLDRLERPVLAVPGNHDIPLGNLLRRFVRPFDRFQSYISDTVTPSFRDEELTVFGLNTARATTWKNGRISRAQLETMTRLFAEAHHSRLKVLVSHHPLLPSPQDPTLSVVGDATLALRIAEACGTDLVLAGHRHVGYCDDVRAHHSSVRRSMLVVQAGTATSCRTRGETNTFNVVVFAAPLLTVTVRAWDGRQFSPVKSASYIKRDGQWVVIPAPQ